MVRPHSTFHTTREMLTSLQDKPHKLQANEVLSVPKNRSTGNLLAEASKAAARIRFSLDSGKSGEYDTMARSPIVPEHEHGLGASGLRRIRQFPSSRAPTLPPSPESSFTLPSRSSSMTLNLTQSRTFTPGGPTSPTLAFGEDLTRFPSESLHSFSFAHQSEDVLHNRQNVIRRSIEFMRDRLGWAAHHPGLVNAQAKVDGDLEIQSMLELLARAQVLGKDPTGPGSFGMLGPLTGPANVEGENVFDREFLPRSESPCDTERSLSPKGSGDASVQQSRPDSSQSKAPGNNQPQSPEDPILPISLGDSSVAKSTQASAVRTGLKRTYTDIAPLTLQTRLVEALAKPYKARDAKNDGQLLSPTMVPSFGKALTAGPNSLTFAHGHSQRWAPAAQAIFTTETQAPWTILAANDLACLVFGVTKAEVRKLGILEVVREDRRSWLEERLKAPGVDTATKERPPLAKAARVTPSPSTSLAMRGGITALLLSKPSSRQLANKRSQTDDGSGSSLSKSQTKKGNPKHPSTRSRGVLLCGDVVPIQKRNGATGSASLWVKEKKGGLIWVLEEIVEDIAHITLDETGKVLSATGAADTIWGEGTALERKELRRLIPKAPMTSGNTKKVDYENLSKVEHFTARNPEGYNIPTSITTKPHLGELRVSSFPHIAGIMVLSSSTLQITSSNSAFSSALFGQPNPDGLHITELIPQFAKLLNLLTEEENVDLADGIVVPEHSFRRARALLALREGNADAAAIFLRPTGLGAKHRDGSDINVDVQMRVVKSDKVVPEQSIIEEPDDESDTRSEVFVATSELVYALWITYSRHLHSVVRPGGPASPLISRPGTPPRQPSPGQSIDLTSTLRAPAAAQPPMSPASFVTQQIQEATMEPISSRRHQQPAVQIKPEPAAVEEPPKKKTISDFIILEEMGQGAYGQVKLARYKKMSNKVVLKYVTKKRILVDTWTRDRKLGTVPLEIHVLNYLKKDGLKHPNIVEMTDFFEDNINYYIEMVPHGLPGMDLFDYIEMRSTMEEAECRNIFLQVVAALHHLHTKALVVHRDIKDENIVLDGENRVKLIDFGSAAYIKNGPFDVFVGTIGRPAINFHPVPFPSANAQPHRLCRSRSPPGQELQGKGARRLGTRHTSLHPHLQGKSLLQRRRDPRPRTARALGHERGQHRPRPRHAQSGRGPTADYRGGAAASLVHGGGLIPCSYHVRE